MESTLLNIPDYINTPFNYTGSKFKLLPQILPLFDYSKDYFVDLFTGGGSVYTNVVDRYKLIIINDIIKELVDIHYNLINNPQEFIEQTKEVIVKDKNDAEAYAELRSSFNKEKTPQKLRALMLSCTNNMLRMNKSFGFNQTFGKRTWNDSTEKKVNEFVNHIQKYKDKIHTRSNEFDTIRASQPTMYYIDPPYTNTEAGYNCYWGQKSEDRLYEFIKYLNDYGHSFMLSGVHGPHKNGKESEIINKLISDGFKHKFLEFNYDKVSRSSEPKISNEIVIYNY